MMMKAMNIDAQAVRHNPDFDDGLVVWADQYSGRYRPVAYGDQFDDQWRLEQKRGFDDHTGVEVSDLYIDDRIFEIDNFQGKSRLDLGCGPGRWTKTLMALGANVTSVDISEHGVPSIDLPPAGAQPWH